MGLWPVGPTVVVDMWSLRRPLLLEPVAVLDGSIVVPFPIVTGLSPPPRLTGSSPDEMLTGSSPPPMRTGYSPPVISIGSSPSPCGISTGSSPSPEGISTGSSPPPYPISIGSSHPPKVISIGSSPSSVCGSGSGWLLGSQQHSPESSLQSPSSKPAGHSPVVSSISSRMTAR